MSSTVKSVAHVHAADIDTTVVKSGVTWEGLANVCVAAAERALETPPKGYTPMQRNSLTDTRAWNELHNAHMLANAVWNIRTKGLLGVVG